jgi:hypothetical protein
MPICAPTLPPRVSRLVAAAGWTIALASCSTTPNELLIRIAQGDREAKREAIVKLGELLAEKEAAGFPLTEGDREALELLKDIAKKDTEPMQRMRAIAALRGLERLDSTDIFIEGLEANHRGVRWECAKGLASQPTPRAVPALVARLRKEPDELVELHLIQALVAVEDPAALQALLEIFLDSTGRFEHHQMKVHRAITRQSGRNFGREDRASWQRLYEELRSASTPPRGEGP